VTFDTILDRLQHELTGVAENRPFLIITVIVVGVACMVIHVLYRKCLADLYKRLQASDEQLTRARTEATKLNRDLEALGDERQARQNLEMVISSLRQQLTSAKERLRATAPPATPPSPGDPIQARLDGLFGSGSAIDGELTKEEAKRLVFALHELTDIIKARVGSEREPGPSQLRARLYEANPAWWSYVFRNGIPHAIELVAAFRAEVLEFANSLEQVITRQPDLEFRLRTIVGNVGVIAALLNVAGGFIRSLEHLNDGETYKPAVLAMALGSPFRVMVQAQSAVDEWMHVFLEQRVPAVCREISTFVGSPAQLPRATSTCRGPMEPGRLPPARQTP